MCLNTPAFLRKNKKLIITTFIIAPFLSLFFCLQIQKQVTKREVKWKLINSVHEDELVLLKFSNSEIYTKLNWEHSREFEYNNEMYDIVKTTTTHDSTFYWCWWDNEETLLNKKLDTLYAFAIGIDEKQKKNKSNVLVFLKTIIFQENNYSIIDKNTLTTIHHFVYCNNNKSKMLSVSSPPPKAIALFI